MMILALDPVATQADQVTFIVVAAIGFGATVTATVLGSFLTAKAATQAREEVAKVAATTAASSADARLGLVRAQEAASRAEIAASDAAWRLENVNRTTNSALAEINVGVKNTHAIVNSEHVKLLRNLATLTWVIARQDPRNVKAQEAAAAAEIEATKSEEAAASLITLDDAGISRTEMLANARARARAREDRLLAIENDPGLPPLPPPVGPPPPPPTRRRGIRRRSP